MLAERQGVNDVPARCARTEAGWPGRLRAGWTAECRAMARLRYISAYQVTKESREETQMLRCKVNSWAPSPAQARTAAPAARTHFLQERWGGVRGGGRCRPTTGAQRGTSSHTQSWPHTRTMRDTPSTIHPSSGRRD